jgi:hypothetical protein
MVFCPNPQASNGQNEHNGAIANLGTFGANQVHVHQVLHHGHNQEAAQQEEVEEVAEVGQDDMVIEATESFP